MVTVGPPGLPIGGKGTALNGGLIGLLLAFAPAGIGISGSLAVANYHHRGLLLPADTRCQSGPMRAFLHFGAMPLSASSLIAASFFDRCASPMPRNTFGALVN
jgi:hypothetical protein